MLFFKISDDYNTCTNYAKRNTYETNGNQLIHLMKWMIPLTKYFIGPTYFDRTNFCIFRRKYIIVLIYINEILTAQCDYFTRQILCPEACLKSFFLIFIPCGMHSSIFLTFPINLYGRKGLNFRFPPCDLPRVLSHW